MLAGDRLAIYMDNPGAIGYVFDISMMAMLNAHTVDTSLDFASAFAMFDTVTFDSLSLPYNFQVTAYIGIYGLGITDLNKVECKTIE